MMKTNIRLSLLFLSLLPALLFLSGCGKPEPACPVGAGTPTRLTLSPAELPSPTPGAAPIEVEIGGRLVRVDKVVEGALCNDTWNGTVYVTCNVQVYDWQETPTFLKNCNLIIAPDTVVYVAYHNDTAYYKGCSCHTGEIAEP
jgi:hypothetical protein